MTFSLTAMNATYVPYMHTHATPSHHHTFPSAMTKSTVATAAA